MASPMLFGVCLVFALVMNNAGQGHGDVDFEMRIDPETPEQQFQIGENRILICKAFTTQDGQRPDLHWEINGERVTATGSDERIRTQDFIGNLLLRISDVQDGDGGVYTCVGNLAGQTDFRSVTVEVFTELEILSSQDQYGILGEDGEVMCEATSKPAPSTSWKFENGSRIINNDKYIIQPTKLIIKNLQFSDAKRYLCDVIVIKTGKSKAFYINFEVVQKPTIPLPPTIQPNNPKVGDEVKITCNAEGVPAPTYQFRRDDSLLPEDQVDEVNGILTLPDVRREDEGNYTCVASNRGGSAESSVMLDVKIAPVIQVSVIHIIDTVDGSNVSVTDTVDGSNVSVIDVVEDSKVRVICTAEGDPAPTVTWARQGWDPYTVGGGYEWAEPKIVVGDGDEGDDVEIKRVVRIMEFKWVSHRYHADTYVCTALNVAGNVSVEIEINVKYAPFVDIRWCFFCGEDVYGWKGQKAKLTCEFDANEEASIVWYIPDDKFPSDASKWTVITNAPPYSISIPPADPYNLVSMGSLIIDIGDGEDKSLYREYLCEATNSVGTSDHSVRLREAFPPGPPGVTVSCTLSTMVTLKVLKPADDGGLRVRHFLYEYSPADDPSDITQGRVEYHWMGTIIELRNLTSATSYMLSVQAVNAVGPGSNQTITFTTKN